jgi:aryl-alcohol dehydrogenase-like predicted oxidoreductase
MAGSLDVLHPCAMKTRRIGSLEVSVVGLGCNNFGSRLDADGTANVVSAAIEAGINLFDTADIYGGTQSEVFLGRALGARRDKVVLATKFGAPINGAPAGAAPSYIRTAVEDSLRRLGTDRIDLYQLHQPDPQVPIGETLAVLDELVRAGKILAIGCSNFSLAQLREAETAAPDGAAHFVSVQNELSLLHRTDLIDVIPECAARSIAYLPYFPLAGGMLSGKYQGAAGKAAVGRLASGGKLAERFRAPANAALVDKLTSLAEGHGHTLLELAFAWLLSFPAVASVIAGATTPEQVQANVATTGWELGEVELRELATVLAL